MTAFTVQNCFLLVIREYAFVLFIMNMYFSLSKESLDFLVTFDP